MSVETRIADAEYLQIKLVAKKRKERAGGHTFNTNDAHLIGLLGEAAFASVTGLKVNFNLSWGDSGIDFRVGDSTIQVKTREVKNLYPPDLIVDREDFKCDYYVLCQWERHFPQIVNMVGWCTKATLVSRSTEDFGYGPKYVVRRSELADADVFIQRIREKLGTRR